MLLLFHQAAFVLASFALVRHTYLQLLFVHVAIVGRLGTLPLAAVGLSNLLFFFCTVFFSFLLVVTTPKVATAIANNKAQEVNILTAPAAT